MSAGVWPAKSKQNSVTRNGATEGAVDHWGRAGRRSRRLLRVVVAVAIVLLVASKRPSLLAATERLARISPAWLALAVGAEIASFIAAAELQHHLLAGTGTRVGRRFLIALSYAATAMSATLPAGPAVSSGYSYRALTRRGTTAGAAAWVLFASAVLSIVTLAVLGLIGAQLRGFGLLCTAAGGTVGGSVLLVTGGAVATLVWSSRHRRRLELLASSLSARCNSVRAVVARRRGHPIQLADTDVSRRSWLSDDRVEQRNGLGPARLIAALGLASANSTASSASGWCYQPDGWPRSA